MKVLETDFAGLARVIFTLNLPETSGVPEIFPVEGSIFKPSGSPVADHVKGAVPIDSRLAE